MNSISRRQFLQSAAMLAAAPVFAPLTARAAKSTHALSARLATASLMGVNAPTTEVWSFNRSVPGPILRIPQGQPVHIPVTNTLKAPTTVHWHGIRIENAMDGVSGMTQEPIQPGATFDYRFTAPDAGTYWYHSHHRSWEQVARGLYGMLVVEESSPVDVDRDVAFVADDWRLDDDGQIAGGMGHLRDASHGGRLGNWLTINGTSRPTLKARPGERLRLRCLCAANARVMAFDFAELRPYLVALDGQPLATPEDIDGNLWLAPGQRADLIVDIPADGPQVFTIREASTREPIVAATVAVDGPPISGHRTERITLPANPLPYRLDMTSAERVDLLMEGGAMGALREATYQGKLFDLRTLAMEKGKVWTFNGVAGMPTAPLLRVARGRTVVIDMVNDTRWPHAMHLHGHHFRIIAKNGSEIPPGPWRDTELMQPGDRASAAFVADNPGKWLFHCHMLEHHMAGMGTWIEVG